MHASGKIFMKIRSVVFTDGHTHKQTNEHRLEHNLLGGGNKRDCRDDDPTTPSANVS